MSYISVSLPPLPPPHIMGVKNWFVLLLFMGPRLVEPPFSPLGCPLAFTHTRSHQGLRPPGSEQPVDSAPVLEQFYFWHQESRSKEAFNSIKVTKFLMAALCWDLDGSDQSVFPSSHMCVFEKSETVTGLCVCVCVYSNFLSVLLKMPQHC